jgi:hypothetical protein
MFLPLLLLAAAALALHAEQISRAAQMLNSHATAGAAAEKHACGLSHHRLSRLLRAALPVLLLLLLLKPVSRSCLGSHSCNFKVFLMLNNIVNNT